MRASRSLAVLMLLLVSVARAGLVPESELWPAWDASDESNAATIDHSAWQTILDAYLNADHPSAINRFDYAAVSAADEIALNDYLQEMQAIDPRAFSRVEQRAYWINLYNAATVDLVVKHYPVKSIRKIYGGLFGLGPWNKELLNVAGETLTLNDIEHRILRPIWQDPRIHYALNCASLGCPNLAPRAYTAANTDALLDAGAHAYVNHPRGARFDGEHLRVSSIYDWYQVDFGDSERGVIEHLKRYAEPELRGRLIRYGGKLRYDYDWGLNAP